MTSPLWVELFHIVDLVLAKCIQRVLYILKVEFWNLDLANIPTDSTEAGATILLGAGTNGVVIALSFVTSFWKLRDTCWGRRGSLTKHGWDGVWFVWGWTTGQSCCFTFELCVFLMQHFHLSKQLSLAIHWRKSLKISHNILAHSLNTFTLVVPFLDVLSFWGKVRNDTRTRSSSGSPQSCLSRNAMNQGRGRYLE